MPPKYDFAAADRLSQQLSQLVEKLDWFIWLREGQRKSLLGSPHSDNWQGAKRNRFETDFARQRSALTELKAAALRLKSQVDQATTAAHTAQKSEQKQ
ncbi:hypothetical protein ABT174_08315 [Streptomyces sparsogenes]|uniref:hypothetical protein n=1 Tax=Streptomyces sparsogenes TaxID=67365 RepID=UPI0033232744